MVILYSPLEQFEVFFFNFYEQFSLNKYPTLVEYCRMPSYTGAKAKASSWIPYNFTNIYHAVNSSNPVLTHKRSWLNSWSHVLRFASFDIPSKDLYFYRVVSPNLLFTKVYPFSGTEINEAVLSHFPIIRNNFIEKDITFDHPDYLFPDQTATFFSSEGKAPLLHQMLLYRKQLDANYVFLTKSGTFEDRELIFLAKYFDEINKATKLDMEKYEEFLVDLWPDLVELLELFRTLLYDDEWRHQLLLHPETIPNGFHPLRHLVKAKAPELADINWVLEDLKKRINNRTQYTSVELKSTRCYRLGYMVTQTNLLKYGYFFKEEKAAIVNDIGFLLLDLFTNKLQKDLWEPGSMTIPYQLVSYPRLDTYIKGLNEEIPLVKLFYTDFPYYEGLYNRESSWDRISLFLGSPHAAVLVALNELLVFMWGIGLFIWDCFACFVMFLVQLLVIIVYVCHWVLQGLLVIYLNTSFVVVIFVGFIVFFLSFLITEHRYSAVVGNGIYQVAMFIEKIKRKWLQTIYAGFRSFFSGIDGTAIIWDKWFLYNVAVESYKKIDNVISIDEFSKQTFKCLLIVKQLIGSRIYVQGYGQVLFLNQEIKKVLVRYMPSEKIFLRTGVKFILVVVKKGFLIFWYLFWGLILRICLFTARFIIKFIFFTFIWPVIFLFFLFEAFHLGGFMYVTQIHQYLDKIGKKWKLKILKFGQNRKQVNLFNGNFLLLSSLLMLTTSVVETNIKSESFLISGNFTVFNYSLFLFIFFANLSGMVPYAFTLTSHLSVTMLLSTTVFAGSTIISCRKYGWQFFSLFFPSGVPLVIALFLIFIETLSYIIRLFSLGIRLFANLMAGHTLIKILSLFSWSLFYNNGWSNLGYCFLSLIPTLIILLVTFLEVAIGFLQAYVFVTLSAIYTNDGLNAVH